MLRRCQPDKKPGEKPSGRANGTCKGPEAQRRVRLEVLGSSDLVSGARGVR